MVVRSLPEHSLIDRLVRGRAWIPVLGILLAGIVAMQVEILKLGTSMGRSLDRTTVLQGENESLQASVATLSDDQRIERLGAGMGLVMPSPSSLTFLRAQGAQRLGRALAGIHAPDPATFAAQLAAQLAAAATIAPATTTASPTAGAPTGASPAAAPGTSASLGEASAGPTSAGAPAAGAPAAGASGTATAGAGGVATAGAGGTATAGAGGVATAGSAPVTTTDTSTGSGPTTDTSASPSGPPTGTPSGG